MTLQELLDAERITPEEFAELAKQQEPTQDDPPPKKPENEPKPKGASWFEDYVNDLNGGN